MDHLLCSVGLLGAVTLVGLEACEARGTGTRSAGMGGSTASLSAGGSIGTTTGESASMGAGGAGGAIAATCPAYDPAVSVARAPALLHPPDIYEIFVFGVVEGYAYFVEGQELRRVPVQGGSAETVGPIYPSWVRMVGTERVLWVEPGDDAETLRIVSAPLTDPTDTSVAVEAVPSVAHLVVDESHVYWADVDTHEVFRAPLSGGDPELLVTEAQPLGAVLHDGYYYWLDYASDYLERILLDGGEREELTPILYGGPMAAADGAIYWGDTSLSTIEKWSPEEGKVRLAHAIDPMQIQVADETVFWSQGLLGGRVRAIGVDGDDERDVLCEIRARPSIVVTDEHVLVGGGSGLIRVTR